MATKIPVMRVGLMVMLACMVSILPALAGSAVIGSVAGSSNAWIGGETLLPNTTIFSGDSLQVHDGVAVVAVGKSGRLVFGRDTVASFERNAGEVTVLLSQGNVSVFHPGDGAAVRVKVGEISVAPTTGFKSLAEVAMLSGSVIVSAKEGALDVDDHGSTKRVAQGHTIVITPKIAQTKSSGGAGWGGGSTTIEVATLGAAVAAAILAAIAIGRADNATNAANKANSSAEAAATAAAQAATNSANALLVAQCTYDLLATATSTSPIVINGTCPPAP